MALALTISLRSRRTFSIASGGGPQRWNVSHTSAGTPNARNWRFCSAQLRGPRGTDLGSHESGITRMMAQSQMRWSRFVPAQASNTRTATPSLSIRVSAGSARRRRRRTRGPRTWLNVTGSVMTSMPSARSPLGPRRAAGPRPAHHSGHLHALAVQPLLYLLLTLARLRRVDSAYQPILVVHGEELDVDVEPLEVARVVRDHRDRLECLAVPLPQELRHQIRVRRVSFQEQLPKADVRGALRWIPKTGHHGVRNIV